MHINPVPNGNRLLGLRLHVFAVLEYDVVISEDVIDYHHLLFVDIIWE